MPSHWVLHPDGDLGRPIYTNVRYPFPVDPPHVATENPTGDHRRRFTLPAYDAWTRAEQVLLRFDGVESTYRVWLNGVEIGVGEASRLMQEFDITHAVRSGENHLTVRVHQWSSASYLEDQDRWWLPGIFREVSLLARPVGRLDDFWLRAEYDHVNGTGLLLTEGSAPRKPRSQSFLRSPNRSGRGEPRSGWWPRGAGPRGTGRAAEARSAPQTLPGRSVAPAWVR